MKRSSDIRSFFPQKRANIELDEEQEKPSTSATTTSDLSVDAKDEIYSQLDIGYAVDRHLNASERYKFLKQAWTPPENYKFPSKIEKNHTRQFQREWLKKYDWLVYSKFKDGAFCKFCCLFAPAGGGVNFRVSSIYCTCVLFELRVTYFLFHFFIAA